MGESGFTFGAAILILRRKFGSARPAEPVQDSLPERINFHFVGRLIRVRLPDVVPHPYADTRAVIVGIFVHT